MLSTEWHWGVVPKACLSQCGHVPNSAALTCDCRSVTLMKMANDDMAMKDGTGSMTMLTGMKVADNTNKQVGRRGCCHWPGSSLGLHRWTAAYPGPPHLPAQQAVILLPRSTHGSYS